MSDDLVTIALSRTQWEALANMAERGVSDAQNWLKEGRPYDDGYTPEEVNNVVASGYYGQAAAKVIRERMATQPYPLRRRPAGFRRRLHTWVIACYASTLHLVAPNAAEGYLLDAAQESLADGQSDLNRFIDMMVRTRNRADAIRRLYFT